MPRKKKKTEKTETKEEVKEKKGERKKKPRKEREKGNKDKKRKEEKEGRDKEKTGKEKEKGERKKKQKLLIPLEDYIGCSVHIGTRVITPTMRQYVYRRKADGLAVINTMMIDEKIKVAADFISQYDPKDIIVVCKREAGWKPIETFSELTGIRIFTKKYPAGIITNPDLENFFEPKLLIIVDPWVDKNALNDAVKIHIPIVSLCDTNNNTNYIDIVLPCNNKTNKSISLIFYLLSKFYVKNRKIKTKVVKEDFYKIENNQKERIRRKEQEKERREEKKPEKVKEGV
jgi:small subunit ribosomal protein S2